MAAVTDLRIEIRFAWWWWPYYYGLLTMVLITGLEPDDEKFYDHFFRALRFRFGGARRWHRLSAEFIGSLVQEL